jgi:hypothetical protein
MKMYRRNSDTQQYYARKDKRTPQTAEMAEVFLGTKNDGIEHSGTTNGGGFID